MSARQHQRIVAGDASAFADAVCPLEPRLRAVAARFRLCGDDIDDLVQDVLVAAWEHRRDLRADAPIYPWLRTMLENRCLNLLRSRQRRSRSQADLARLALAQALEDADRAGDERFDALQVCLEGLAPGQRRLLDQRYAERHPVQDLADVYRVSAKGMSMRLARLRTALRACMEQRLEEVS